MGAEQREATRARRRDLALARWGLICLTLGLVLSGVARSEEGEKRETADRRAQSNSSQPKVRTGSPASRRTKPAAKETPPHSQKAPESVQLPGYVRSDTGRIADPRALRGDSKIANANATLPANERAVRPILPAAELDRPGGATEPPPFQEARVFPVEKPVPLSATTSPEPEGSLAVSGNAEPAPSAGSVPPSSAPVETDPFKGLERPPEEPAPTEHEARAVETSAERPARASVPSADAAPALPAETNRRVGRLKDRPRSSEHSVEDPRPSTPERQVAFEVLDQIRVEIKRRLSYFQACADAARRRTGLEIRRLQATWSIAADGTIKALKFEGIPDAQLSTCLTRAGSRPFPVEPGMDLTIPTPIVFVR